MEETSQMFKNSSCEMINLSQIELWPLACLNYYWFYGKKNTFLLVFILFGLCSQIPQYHN